jgi:putative membrane protein
LIRRWPRLPAALLAGVLAALALSAWEAADGFTWFLEVFPVLLGVPLLIATRRRFPLTPLAYVLLAGHAAILITGGHYTYAKVPLFEWLRAPLHFRRNHFDRLGHFAQGFVPAVVAREVLVRSVGIRRRGWLAFLTVCVCLAISASYELLEWGVAEATGSAADAFLGTQGDPWDTQWDMFFALIGAACSLLALSRAHDRQLAELGQPAAFPPR